MTRLINESSAEYMPYKIIPTIMTRLINESSEEHMPYKNHFCYNDASNQ